MTYLYHGTNPLAAKKIDIQEGLKGGLNLVGGNAGIFTIPTLAATPDLDVAIKYGNRIFRFDTNLNNWEYLINMRGETEYRKEGKGIIIPSPELEIIYYSPLDNSFENDYGEKVDPYIDEHAWTPLMLAEHVLTG